MLKNQTDGCKVNKDDQNCEDEAGDEDGDDESDGDGDGDGDGDVQAYEHVRFS